MINNKEFNEWLEKEKGYAKETVEIGWFTNDELIGLMTQWLLDKGFTIFKFGGIYNVVEDAEIINKQNIISRNKSLYDCLVEAINKLGEV